ncbi:MAG: SDR family NAD(P)-dependent oxidoreductase [bacterium]|nr:SDR family NAD(P)-dependent oxidoreductase [bacterium]
MRLKGKVAVVTGGGSGNGRGISLGLAREGAMVAVPDLNLTGAQETCRLIRRAGGKAQAYQADVTAKDAVQALFQQIKTELGEVDVLVNNVGVALFSPFLETTEETWQITVDVNLKSTFLCTQTVAAAMIARGHKGSIVNIASIAGFIGMRGLAHYAAVKAGVILLTKSAALELAPHGIRVNAIAPGIIHTPATHGRVTDPDRLKLYLSNIPLGRVGDPEDLAGAAVYLGSEESSYATGTVITLDGGWIAQ